MLRNQFLLITISVIIFGGCSRSDFETIKQDFKSSDLQTVSRLANIPFPNNVQIQLGYLFTAKDDQLVFKLQLPVNELDELRQALSSYKSPEVQYDAKLYSSHPALSQVNPIIENFNAVGLHVLICKAIGEHVDVYIEAFSPPYRQEFADARELIRGK
jgi:hypothetical protein